MRPCLPSKRVYITVTCHVLPRVRCTWCSHAVMKGLGGPPQNSKVPENAATSNLLETSLQTSSSWECPALLALALGTRDMPRDRRSACAQRDNSPTCQWRRTRHVDNSLLKIPQILFLKIFTLFLHCSHAHFGVPVMLKLCALCCTIHVPFRPAHMSANIHTFFERKPSPRHSLHPRSNPLQSAR